MKMKRISFPQTFFFGGCAVTGVLLIILGSLAAGGLWRALVTPSGKTAIFTDLSRAHEIYVRAPFFRFCTGALYVLYEGSVSTNAVLELVSNHGRDKAVIPLSAGEVSGVYGGAEEWVPDLSVRFVPHGVSRGTLKIAAVCGRAFTDEEREWFNKLYKKEFDARAQESRLQTKGE